MLPPNQAPDELLIDWEDMPAGSEASIYLPGVSAQTVLAMADKLYSHHGLSRSDAHTLTCSAHGITYVPIPPGVGSNYAGLMTVDLPATVRRGQLFKAVTRQITNASARRPPPPPPPPSLAAPARQVAVPDIIEWRGVAGSFQVTVPVEARQALLGQESRLLSVLRWIARGIPRHDRWYPVFHRYLEQTAGRVSALGGDPAQILPSPRGDGGKPSEPRPKPGERLHFTGKIAGLVFDRFGDFEGFLLDTEDGERSFRSRERDIKELAERAWRERLRITVRVERDDPHRPLSIIVREPPEPFRG